MSKGRFGIHGGQYVPETIMNAVNELEATYNKYKDDPEFNRELTELYNEYAGRPSRLYYAERMSKDLGGAKIYLKREDLNHTGLCDHTCLTHTLCQKHLSKYIVDRRDRCRSAWCCNGNGCSHDGHGV